MKVKVEELSSVRRKITVEIEAQEVNRALDGAYRRLQGQARLKGFRPGKAPRAILERYYAPQALADTAESLVQQTYAEALGQSKLEPVAQPEFDFKSPVPGQDFAYDLTLDVRPVFDLPAAKYKGLTLKEPDLLVTDEEVARRLEALRERQAVLVPLEAPRPAVPGDVLVVNYTSFLGEEPADNGAADNVEVELGKGRMPEEMEKVLLGTKPGDMVETVVNHGQDAPNPKLRGQAVRYKFLVKEQKAKVLPELDDDFARSVSPEFADLAELKKRIADDLSRAYEDEKEAALRAQILDQLREMAEFELPASLVAAEVEDMIESFKQRLARQGLDPAKLTLDPAKLKEEFQPTAERKIKAGIVLGQVADQEKVTVETADEEAHLARMAERLGATAEVIREMYNKNNMMSSVRAQVLEEKTLRVIRADAIIKKVPPAELAMNTAKTGANPIPAQD